MSERLLREYLTLVVEKIRSKKVPRSQNDRSKKGFGDHFDLKKFKEIKDEQTMLLYAKNFLEVLGMGTSRIAFLLSGKYVLKIAMNDKGLGQNEAELDVYTNPKTKLVVSKIYAAESDNKWLISDLVKPIESEEEFESLAGVEWTTFCKQVIDGVKFGDLDGANSFVKAVVATAKASNMLGGDMVDINRKPGEHSVIGHWGKTPDGRVVLLDYGLTRGVWDTHYKSEREAMRAAQAQQLSQRLQPDSDASGNAKTAVDSYAPTRLKSAEEFSLPQRKSVDRSAKTAAQGRAGRGDVARQGQRT